MAKLLARMPPVISISMKKKHRIIIIKSLWVTRVSTWSFSLEWATSLDVEMSIDELRLMVVSLLVEDASGTKGKCWKKN